MLSLFIAGVVLFFLHRYGVLYRISYFYRTEIIGFKAELTPEWKRGYAIGKRVGYTEGYKAGKKEGYRHNLMQSREIEQKLLSERNRIIKENTIKGICQVCNTEIIQAQIMDLDN